jgi:hypothetical protein
LLERIPDLPDTVLGFRASGELTSDGEIKAYTTADEGILGPGLAPDRLSTRTGVEVGGLIAQRAAENETNFGPNWGSQESASRGGIVRPKPSHVADWPEP